VVNSEVAVGRFGAKRPEDTDRLLHGPTAALWEARDDAAAIVALRLAGAPARS